MPLEAGKHMRRVGQNRISAPYMTYDRIYGNFPAKNTVCTPYISINVWLWPALHMREIFIFL